MDCGTVLFHIQWFSFSLGKDGKHILRLYYRWAAMMLYISWVAFQVWGVDCQVGAMFPSWVLSCLITYSKFWVLQGGTLNSQCATFKEIHMNNTICIPINCSYRFSCWNLDFILRWFFIFIFLMKHGNNISWTNAFFLDYNVLSVPSP